MASQSGLHRLDDGGEPQHQGTETVNVINDLALITVNVGKPGASPFSITDNANAMGTREAGFTSSLPGYRKFESATIGRVGGGSGASTGNAYQLRRMGIPRHHRGAVSKKIPLYG